MKAFLFLLVIIGLGVGIFFGYQHFIQKDKPSSPSEGEVAGGTKPGDDKPQDRKPDTTIPSTPKVRSESDEIAKLYPMPEFKTLEELTNGWTNIPPQAFPSSLFSKD